MFAVLRTGGKQYKVAKGDVLKVERLTGEPGDIIALEDVLLIAGAKVEVGTPVIEKVAVQVEIINHTRAPKVIAFKKRRRKDSKWRKGHRQHLTEVKVIDFGAGLVSETKKTVPAAPVTKSATKSTTTPETEKVAKASAVKPKTKTASETGAKTDSRTDLEVKVNKDQKSTAETTKKVEKSEKVKDAKPVAKDDLKKISGIGPVLEKKLNGFGITSYDHIAKLKKADIARINESLSFSGRIEREKWVEQARKLINK